MMISVTPCCKKARQDGRKAVLHWKKPPRTFMECVHKPLLARKWNVFFELLHCFVFWAAWSSSKCSWQRIEERIQNIMGKKSLCYGLEWLLVCCQVRRGGCAKLMQWQQWAPHRCHTVLSTQTREAEQGATEQQAGEEAAASLLCNALCAQFETFPRVFSWLLLLAFLPSAANQKYG